MPVVRAGSCCGPREPCHRVTISRARDSGCRREKPKVLPSNKYRYQGNLPYCADWGARRARLQASSKPKTVAPIGRLRLDWRQRTAAGRVSANLTLHSVPPEHSINVSSRAVSQLLLLAMLFALGGWWLWAMLHGTLDAHSPKVGEQVLARYWFAVLLFSLLSTVQYLIFRRRSIRSLVIGYLICAAVSVAGTVTVVRLGHEAANLSNESPKPDTSPSDGVQALPIPGRVER